MAMAEAEGEDTEGKALVILVIYNRTRSGKFPDTVKGVISQRNAFTSYSNGRYDRVEPDADCWAALDLIQETGWDESQGALYFERTPEDGESTWHSRNLERLFIHGNHTFYTEKEAKDP
ncbi:MAG: cell wall hydrolase [Lachnospiraceae bacterium]